jgi:outer membrane protein assembly factor BamB
MIPEEDVMPRPLPNPPPGWVSVLALALCVACSAQQQGATDEARGDSEGGGEAPRPGTPWTRYAGPTQDFKVPDHGLADEWSRGGPRRLWSRKLGPGYSGIVVQEDRLYTMYRADPEEVVVCLDAPTGETLWEYRYRSSPVEGHDPSHGDGPNSTPLLTDGRLCTIGVAGILHCLDADTGEVRWSRDLWAGLGGTFLDFGYSSSPIPYGDTIIVLVGGRDRGAVAFDKRDGSIVWESLSFENSYSTPTIMNILGEEHLVTFMATEVVGADPNTGELRWQYFIRNQYPQNICLPIQVDDDLVFISTLEAGSRGLKVVKRDAFDVEEVWSSRRFQCFYGSSVRFGDYVYGPSGYSRSPRMVAINARTGELAWRKRGFALANVIGVGNRLVILDDEGTLALATPGPEDLTVHAEARVLSAPARTPPTIVSNVVYARDQESIVALDLGPTD